VQIKYKQEIISTALSIDLDPVKDPYHFHRPGIPCPKLLVPVHGAPQQFIQILHPTSSMGSAHSPDIAIVIAAISLCPPLPFSMLLTPPIAF
jgi:hypothetical protein